MDPILNEILRIKHGDQVRPDVVMRWQRHIRQTLVPALEELDALKATKATGRPRKDAEAVA